MMILARRDVLKGVSINERSVARRRTTVLETSSDVYLGKE
jgi:hypothetical protein